MRISYLLVIFLSAVFFFQGCRNGGSENGKSSEVSKKTENKPEFKITLPEKKNVNPSFSLPPGDFAVEVIKTYPHLRSSFTQGLEYVDRCIYESTGMVGSSAIKKCELETGKVLKKQQIPGLHFGEGLTVFGNRIFQLTWRSGTCFVWEKESFEMLTSYNYDGEGWGITNDGEQLIMSTGSNILKFIDPDGFSEIRRLEIMFQNYPLDYLNELEYVNGEIWANVWQKDHIFRIEPESGRVLGRIDISPLYKYLKPTDTPDVLNGIAYEAENNRIFVTGKYWPFIFEIKPIAK